MCTGGISLGGVLVAKLVQVMGEDWRPTEKHTYFSTAMYKTNKQKNRERKREREKESEKEKQKAKEGESWSKQRKRDGGKQSEGRE